jgi:hypothetical protein
MDEEEVSLNELLVSLLSTEDGDNLCDILTGVKSQMEIIGQQLVMQNKILVKILTALSPTPQAPVLSKTEHTSQ